MQNKEQAVKTLVDELNYCYCDSCKFSDCDVYGDEYCDGCYRKYSNWALSEDFAKIIVDRIYEDNINAE